MLVCDSEVLESASLWGKNLPSLGQCLLPSLTLGWCCFCRGSSRVSPAPHTKHAKVGL